jgi:hypothetical protein
MSVEAKGGDEAELAPTVTLGGVTIGDDPLSPGPLSATSPKRDKDRARSKVKSKAKRGFV